jgi:uncharacterized cupin superfamily protein
MVPADGGRQMKQLETHWYAWSRYRPDRRLDEHGYFLAPAGETPGVAGVVVDPVPFQEGDRDQIAELGGAAAVVLTDPARAAEAARCGAAFGCPVFVPRAVAGGEWPAGLPLRPYAPAEALPGGLAAVGAAADDSGEVALYHEETATLLTGRTVLGVPAGGLSLPRPDDPAAAARAARALRGLLAWTVRRLLVGTGTPLLHPGEAVRALQDLVHRHDPAAFLLRQDELGWDPPAGVWTLGRRFGARFAEYARLLGLRTLDFDLAEVSPGRQSGQLHRHDGEEEVFVVLAGRGEVLTERGAFAIAAGDVLGFPPRYQVAHAFRNTGEDPLRYLAFAAPAETLEMVDYPETGIRMERTPYGKGHRFVLPERQRVPYWEGVRTD